MLAAFSGTTTYRCVWRHVAPRAIVMTYYTPIYSLDYGEKVNIFSGSQLLNWTKNETNISTIEPQEDERPRLSAPYEHQSRSQIDKPTPS